jgi:hypothetical protein
MVAKESEKILRKLEDIQEKIDLHREYVYWVNSYEWDKVIDCFTEDCSANIGRWGLRKGKASLYKLFKENIGHNNLGKDRDGHFAIQPFINVDGDKATGHWMLNIMFNDPVKGNHGVREDMM